MISTVWWYPHSWFIAAHSPVYHLFRHHLLWPLLSIDCSNPVSGFCSECCLQLLTHTIWIQSCAHPRLCWSSRYSYSDKHVFFSSADTTTVPVCCIHYEPHWWGSESRRHSACQVSPTRPVGPEWSRISILAGMIQRSRPEFKRSEWLGFQIRV